MIAAAIARSQRLEPATTLARLREHVAERDEIIVALQHVIRDLRHEIENLQAETAYAAYANRPSGVEPQTLSGVAEPLTQP